MFRFSEVTYDASTETADIGTGLIWDNVYAALEPLGRNVVGGRVTGIGVAGFSLGGGASRSPARWTMGMSDKVQVTRGSRTNTASPWTTLSGSSSSCRTGLLSM